MELEATTTFDKTLEQQQPPLSHKAAITYLEGKLERTLTPNYLYNAVDRGEIASEKVERRHYFKQEDLDTFAAHVKEREANAEKERQNRLVARAQERETAAAQQLALQAQIIPPMQLSNGQIPAPVAGLVETCYRCGRVFVTPADSRVEKFIEEQDAPNGVTYKTASYHVVCADRRCDPAYQHAQELTRQEEMKNQAVDLNQKLISALKEYQVYMNTRLTLLIETYDVAQAPETDQQEEDLHQS